MKSGLANLIKFGAGTVFGATLGATIGVLMAPKSGQELQADTTTYIDYVKVEGERARKEAEARTAERFRQAVHDPSALSSEA